MFHLYRIYNLQPVKHENLRPEKPQLGPQDVGGDEDLDIGEAGLVDHTAGGGRRTRRTRKVKASAEAATESKGEDSAPIDVGPKKRGRRTVKAKGDGTVAEAELQPGKAGQEPDTQDETLTTLLNQEDVPQPVDGATVAVVEAEEHPEAVAAAVKEGDGCGVSKKRGGKSRGGSRQRKIEKRS